MVFNIMPYGSVLVVDDVDTNLFVAEGMLKPYKLKIDTANSGYEAIKKVEAALDAATSTAYDVIFMDHMMPLMDGIETTRKLRESGYTGVIVALTANALVGNDEMFKQNGFDGFIPKPIDIRQLDEVLNKFIRDRYPEEAKKYKNEPALVTTETSAKNLKFVKVFCSDAQKACITLRETFMNGDSKLFATTAHSMRAALKYVGEHEMAELAALLEKAARDGDKEYIAVNTESFIETLSIIVKNLSPEEAVNADTADTVNTAEDVLFLKEQLLLVKTACENYDSKAAYNALNRLKEKPWKTRTQARLENIHDTLFLQSDFEKAAEEADEILKGDNEM